MLLIIDGSRRSMQINSEWRQIRGWSQGTCTACIYCAVAEGNNLRHCLRRVVINVQRISYTHLWYHRRSSIKKMLQLLFHARFAVFRICSKADPDQSVATDRSQQLSVRLFPGSVPKFGSFACAPSLRPVCGFPAALPRNFFLDFLPVFRLWTESEIASSAARDVPQKANSLAILPPNILPVTRPLFPPYPTPRTTSPVEISWLCSRIMRLRPSNGNRPLLQLLLSQGIFPARRHVEFSLFPLRSLVILLPTSLLGWRSKGWSFRPGH